MAQYRIEEMVASARRQVTQGDSLLAAATLAGVAEALMRLGGYQNVLYDPETGMVIHGSQIATKR
jgi:hypothetical protein